MKNLLTAIAVLIATTASAQLSRTFTENFASIVDSADTFAVFVVEGVIPENGVKFVPPQGFFTKDLESVMMLTAENACFTYTDPGVYVIVPFKGGEPLCFGSYVVMNEDYLDYYLEDDCPYETMVTDDHILNLSTHTVGDTEMPLLSQALWNK